MQDIIDEAYGKYAQGSSRESTMHTNLLCDPDLVEDYSDIVKTMPKKVREDEESVSVNGSVVLNPNNQHSSPSKSATFSVGEKFGRYGLASRPKPEPIGGSDKRTEDCSDEYEYSDSEFEDNIETRLKDLSSDANNSSPMKFFNSEQNVGQSSEGDLTTSRSSRTNLQSSTNFVGASDLRASHSDDEGLNSSTSDQEDDDDDDDDEMNEDEFQPLAPPEEIDPSKLYALYPFQGPDPSHCQLFQDQSCVLLNDQDSYWWLVKRCNDGKIGFAPAEILETFPERLARLNCWKNENMSGRSVGSTEGNEGKEQDSANTEDDEASSAPYTKGNKSVSFNDVVSYAERYFQDGSDEALDEEETEQTNKEGHSSEDSHPEKDPLENLQSEKLLLSGSPLDKVYKATLEPEEDDISEVVSDVSFNTGGTLPLHVKKTRTMQTENQHKPEHDYNTEKLKGHLSPVPQARDARRLLKAVDDGLQQTFKAPTIPFAGSKDLPKSNSNYSISTIGEYSPSSSEWTNDSPQVNNGNFDVEPAVEGIPSTRAIKDISKIVSSMKEDDVYDAEDEEDPTMPKATRSETITRDSSHRESTSASSNESSINEGRGTSATTINSTISFNELKNKHHPVVHELYNPLFDRIDELLRKINAVMSD